MGNRHRDIADKSPQRHEDPFRAFINAAMLATSAGGNVAAIFPRSPELQKALLLLMEATGLRNAWPASKRQPHHCEPERRRTAGRRFRPKPGAQRGWKQFKEELAATVVDFGSSAPSTMRRRAWRIIRLKKEIEEMKEKEGTVPALRKAGEASNKLMKDAVKEITGIELPEPRKVLGVTGGISLYSPQPPKWEYDPKTAYRPQRGPSLLSELLDFNEHRALREGHGTTATTKSGATRLPARRDRGHDRPWLGDAVAAEAPLPPVRRHGGIARARASPRPASRPRNHSRMRSIRDSVRHRLGLAADRQARDKLNITTIKPKVGCPALRTCRTATNS
jgi:hypothetical protein